MSNQDLYAEQTCPRCGGTFHKVSSFCPHCGYVKAESWWDKLLGVFRSTTSVEPSKPTSAAVVSTLVGLVLAGFFLYQALQRDSIQSWLLAVFSFIMALRAWFSTRSRTAPVDRKDHTDLPDLDEAEGSDSSPIPQRFFCENCGAEVPDDATTCPKCGMKFDG